MGLLDELKHQAAARRAEDERASARQAQLDQRMRNVLAPAMTRLLDYLKELIEQLNFVQPELFADFEVRGYGRLRRLRQTQFELTRLRDEIELQQGFVLSWSSRGAGTLRLTTLGEKEIDAQRDWFCEHGLKFECRLRQDNAEFTFEPQILVSLQFEADPEELLIRMRTRHYEGPGKASFDFEPAAVDDAFLDDLGLYVVRRSPVVLERSRRFLSEDQRAHIRDALAREKERETERATQVPQDEVAQRANRVKRIKRLFERLRGNAAE